MGIFDVFTGRSAEDAADRNRQLYQLYQAQALGAANAALPQSKEALTNAIGAYTPLSNLGVKYGGATSLLLDALGANGPEARARAAAAFQASPGYEWQRDQALEAVMRRGAALGGLQGGNTIAGVTDRASQLANQEYGNWLGRLGGFVSPEESATSGAAAGRAAGYGALSGLYQTDASNRANIFGNYASGIANSNTNAANAEMNASGNFWNGLMSLGGNVARGYFGGK